MIYILIGFFVIILILVIYFYNDLVRQLNMTLNQKSQIDIQLQRRFDLIPNLVEVVKGYASFEKSTLEAVVNARSQYLNNKNDTQLALEADVNLSSALGRLFVLVEDYPDLMANQSFLNLQNELSNTENKIAFSRQFYNDAVFKLNTKIDMFPSNIIASIFKFKKQDFFEAQDKEKTSININ